MLLTAMERFKDSQEEVPVLSDFCHPGEGRIIITKLIDSFLSVRQFSSIMLGLIRILEIDTNVILILHM